MHFQVTIQTRNNGDVGEAWFVFEHDATDLAALHQTLTADGFLLGRRYDTRPDGPRARRVRRAVECLLSRDIVLQVTVLPELLRDLDGRVLHQPEGAADV